MKPEVPKVKKSKSIRRSSRKKPARANQRPAILNQAEVKKNQEELFKKGLKDVRTVEEMGVRWQEMYDGGVQVMDMGSAYDVALVNETTTSFELKEYVLVVLTYLITVLLTYLTSSNFTG